MCVALETLPPKFEIDEYSQSGHYPQYDEESLFDERVIDWLNRL